MDITQTPAVPVVAVRATRMLDAHERWLSAMEALPKEQVITALNVDPMNVVTLVSGCIDRIVALKEQAARLLPHADLSVFDNVESLVLALGYAAARHKAASAPALSLEELSGKLVDLHEVFRGECALAVKRGLLPAQPLRQLRGTKGHRNQAADVLMMVALLRDNWSRIKDRTGLTAEEVDEGEMYADQLLTAIGERAMAPATASLTLDLRQRAYTLFMRAYEEIRRIVTYLRWYEGDADLIAPTVYASRKKGKADDGTPEEATPETTPAEPAMPPTNVAKTATDVEPGMPGSNPYTS